MKVRNFSSSVSKSVVTYGTSLSVLFPQSTDSPRVSPQSVVALHSFQAGPVSGVLTRRSASLRTYAPILSPAGQKGPLSPSARPDRSKNRSSPGAECDCSREARRSRSASLIVVALLRTVADRCGQTLVCSHRSKRADCRSTRSNAGRAARPAALVIPTVESQ